MASHNGQDIATAYVQILPSTDGMKKNIKEALSGSLSGASKELEGTLGGITKVGAVAVGAATGAVGGFFKSAVNEGMDFDSAMSQVAATMGSTMEEMSSEVGTVDTAWGTFSGNLREYAQYMGENTAWSATQAAEALNYMALAGYDAQTSMEMLPNVLNLASAGGFDLARASDMITDTQTAFGISLERTNQLVDEMAKAASTGNTSVEQLGDAFLVVGGLTQELNGGMVQLKDGSYASVDGVQELEIALTAMANAGIKGSEAGTHMRNMLLKLSSPTSEGTVALEKMGVSVFDTEGKMRSLSDVFGDLSYAMASMTQEEKIQTSQTMVDEEQMQNVSEIYYAYFTLGEPERMLYLEILDILTRRQENITVSTIDAEQLNHVFTCVMHDHPELFYVEGYQYTRYTIGDKVTGISFLGTYSMTEEEIVQNQKKIDEYVNQCFLEMPQTKDEYDKVKYLYEYLINQTEYDKEAPNNQNICSVFVGKRSVCQGYAKALQYLMQKAGMVSTLVTGYTQQEGHAWNLVRVNGAYYYVDATWGDASYALEDGETLYMGEVPTINYDYFLVTTKELCVTHEPDYLIRLPECKEEKDNYYIREGLYLAEYDEDKLKLIFEQAHTYEMGYVMFKCSDEQVFDSVKQKLIEQQGVFRFIKNQGSTIAFTDNRVQRTFSFWL